MDNFSALIKNIVVCYVIMNIYEGMLISKKYDKYIKLFTGIIVILVVLNTGEKFFGQLLGASRQVSTFRKEISDNEIMKKTDKMMNDITKEINKEYEKRIVAFMKENYGIIIKSIRVYGQNNIERIIVKVKNKENNKENNKGEIENIIKENVTKYYDIRKECIKVKFV